MSKTHTSITLPEAITAILLYNNGIYGKTGRMNIDIDAEARRRFFSGLGTTPTEIMEQVRFIGQDYGGTANTLAGQRLPKLISQEIFKIRADYAARVASAVPLLIKIPGRDLVRFIYQPFAQILESPNRKRTWKKWLTWGTKFWHFLSPDTFLILDSRARRFFSIATQSDPVDTYCNFLGIFQNSMHLHKEWFARLEQADGGHSWSDVKLWDKVAYEVGVK